MFVKLVNKSVIPVLVVINLWKNIYWTAATQLKSDEY